MSPDIRTDSAELTTTHWMRVDGLDEPVEALVTIRVEAPHHAAVLVNAAAVAADAALRATTPDHPGLASTTDPECPAPDCGPLWQLQTLQDHVWVSRSDWLEWYRAAHLLTRSETQYPAQAWRIRPHPDAVL